MTLLAESDKSAKVYGLTEIQAKNAAVGTLVRLPREPLSAYAELINDDGDSIRVFAKPRTTRKPAASNTDIQLATDSIAKIRETVNVSKPITYSLIAPGTALVDGEKARRDNDVLGYSYPSGGAFILPNRHISSKNNSDAEYDPETSWNSVSLKDYNDRLTHSSYHEMSHTIAYNAWGKGEYDTGGDALQEDYDKFGVTGQVVSQYGKQSVEEHFAEALARYIMVGDATPEFMALLESKNLLKSQAETSESDVDVRIENEKYVYVDAPPTLFHGTKAELQPGDIVEARGSYIKGKYSTDPKDRRAFATPSISEATSYGLNVYEVKYQDTEKPVDYLDAPGPRFLSAKGFVVVGKLDTIDAPPIRFLKGPRKPYSPKAAVGSSKDAKEKVLSALLDKVKDGEAPWRKPFKDGFNFAGAFVPRNPASKRVYSGLNSIVLKLHQQLEGYEDPRWMTYNQAQSLGGQVRKGETGTPILVPFKRVKKEKDSTTGEEKVTGGYVSFSAKTVFNVAQIDGLTLPDLKTEAGEPKTPLEAQDFIIERYKKSMEAKGLKTPEIAYTYVGEYGSHDSSPNWRPSSDAITLPTKEQFNSPEDMFDTMAHELAHSTGHPSRLDRSELTRDYSTNNASRGKEELIAEISAAILASMFGVNSDFDNTAAYVKSWLKALQDNPEMIVGASSDAQKVVDYLLGMDLGDWSPIEGYSTASKSDKDEE